MGEQSHNLDVAVIGSKLLILLEFVNINVSTLVKQVKQALSLLHVLQEWWHYVH